MSDAKHKTKTSSSALILLILPCVILGTGGCDQKSPTTSDVNEPVAAIDPCVTKPAEEMLLRVAETAEPNLPCVETNADEANAVDPMAAPRFAANSPFDVNYTPPAQEKAGKILWAKSMLYEKAPELVVEKWLTEQPDTQGKCVLIEFWATWCPPCRKSISLLNQLQQRFGEDLVVIGISEESEQDVRALKEPQYEYHMAIDTQKRMKQALEVRGIPHIIILEPEGYVVWEGFPFLAQYELTEDLVGKIIEISKQPAGN